MGFGIAVSVPDGVAVATDSRVVASLQGTAPTVMSETQQKIVPISKHVAVLAIDPYFLAGDVSINTRATLEQLIPDLPPQASLEQVLEELPGRFLAASGYTISEVENLSLRVIGFSEEERAVKVVLIEGLAPIIHENL